MEKLDPDSPDPQYVQLANVLRASIRGGTWAPGDKLPNHGELAVRHEISIGTVKRAYAALEADGLIVTRQGKGAFVRTNPTTDDPTDASLAEIHATLANFGRRLAAVERALKTRR